jgi:ATP-binding cassette, subfamily B, bacterial MsbA
MKELLPYFKLLKPVRLQFVGAILCALIYGASSGFGLPFMTHKIFPLIFSHDNSKFELYTQLKNGEYFPLEGFAEAKAPTLYEKKEDGSFGVVVKKLRMNSQGFYDDEEGERLTEKIFYVKSNESMVEVGGGLFKKNESTKAYLSLEKEETPREPWVLIGAVMMLPVVFLIRGASSFFNIYLISYCGMHVLEQIRLRVFEKYQSISIGFFHSHKSGDLFNRLMGDATSLQNSISNIANDIIKQPITLFGSIGYLVYQSINQKESVFILLCFAVIGVCVVPIRFIGQQLLKRVFLMQEQMGKMASVANENLGAYREVRAFNLEEREVRRFRNAVKIFFELQLKVVRYGSGLNPMVEVVTAIGLSTAIYYGSQKGITLNEILPLMMALYMSYDPIKKMGNMNSQAKTGLAALRRLDYVLNQEDQTPESNDPQPFPETFKTIQFNGINFSYGEGNVLKEIDLEIKEGEVVALVGPSGAGKTTFGALMTRFYDPQEGGVFLDDLDIRDLSKFDLRDHVSIVSQDTFLFDDTVEGNIRLGYQNASMEEIEGAATKAKAHEFIEALPEGYKTKIGEKGTRLSGGQKQRLALARAFLKDAPLLILDEATSALDSESESHIQSALETLVVGKTVFIIAHRFSTIQFATRILVFENGEITGDGDHEALLEHHDLYKDLYERQAKS